MDSGDATPVTTETNVNNGYVDTLQLHKTSELASSLAEEQTDVFTATSAKDEGCRLPLSKADRISVQRLYKSIVRDVSEEENGKDNSFNNINKGATRLFVSLPTKKKKSGSARGKKGVKNSLKPSATASSVPSLFQLPVHLAATVGNASAIKSILSVDKDCLLIGDAYGCAALHHAVRNGHMDVTRLICTYMPQCARIADRRGNLPLHYAVGSASHFPEAPRIISILLSTFPAGLKKADCDGFLPIHIAAKYGSLAGVIALLACCVDSVYERVPSSNLLAVDYAIQGYSFCQLEFGSSDELDEKTPSDESPMKTLQMEGPTSNDSSIKQKKNFEECIAILLMSSYYKRSILLPDHCPRFLPIHAGICACLHPQSWDHLLNIYGKKHCTDFDSDGQTALHLLIMQVEELSSCTFINDDVLVKMIKQIYTLDDLVPLRLDCLGRLPIHVAVCEGVNVEIVSAILDCCKLAATARWEHPPE